MPNVFISYSNKDETLANSILAGLEANGVHCWIAPRNIGTGESWAGSIMRNIRETTIFLLILTKNSNQSNQVRNEVERAISLNKYIVCLRVDDVVLSDDLEYFLSSMQWINAFGKSQDVIIDLLSSAINNQITINKESKEIPEEVVENDAKEQINAIKISIDTQIYKDKFSEKREGGFYSFLSKNKLLIGTTFVLILIVGFFYYRTTFRIKQFENPNNLSLQKQDSTIIKPKDTINNSLQLRQITTLERQQIFGKFEFVAYPQTGNPENIRILGKWERENIITIKIPQLKGVENAPIDCEIQIHKLCAEPLKKAFAEIEARRLLVLVKTWNGSYFRRTMAGSITTLSSHAFGSAFDINKEWNLINSIAAKKGERGSVIELVPIFEKYGFYWGGNNRIVKEGSHFEMVKVP